MPGPLTAPVRRTEDVFGNLPELATASLLLRPIAPADLDDVFELTSDPEVAKYVRREVHTSRDEAQGWIAEVRNTFWGIEHSPEVRLIGVCGFVYWDIANSRAEVAYQLARRYWNRGYATEALLAVIEFGFATMGLNRIDALCWTENRASARVLEKAAMRFEGIVRDAVFAKGAFRNMKLYSILCHEHPAR